MSSLSSSFTATFLLHTHTRAQLQLQLCDPFFPFTYPQI